MKRAVIIDDEEDARSVLRYYISQHTGFVVAGEAKDGFDAVEVINQLQPDVIFLDIEMPGLNGFEVLTRLNEIPAVIFTSAHDQYAIKAFEIHAVDYLLKPYGKTRFETAVSRVLQNQKSLTSLTEDLLENGSPFPRKVLLHQGNRRLLVDLSDIVYGKAEGDYTRIFTTKQELLSVKSIGYLMENWDSENFIRLHRSYFANKNFIRAVERKDRYYYATLTTGESIRISDSFLSGIRKVMF
jgi:two-component system, LytTR family, response regulator